ncbi:struthiocalcin-2-like [Pterocles gutturalis]
MGHPPPGIKPLGDTRTHTGTHTGTRPHSPEGPPVPPLQLLGTGGAAGACAWGWVPLQEGCYGFFSRELSWRRAEAFCQRFGAGAHLASVRGPGGLRAIAPLLRPPRDSEEDEDGDRDDGVWIGLHRPLGSRRWRWSDGSQLGSGVGTRLPGRGRRACAALHHHLMTWFSDSCSDRKPFICGARA